jgi:hypothetical protein
MTSAFNVENLEAFIQDYIKGVLVPKVVDRSTPPEEAPEDNEADDMYVKKITDANYDAEVKNSEKDVMIEFYAPCNKFQLYFLSIFPFFFNIYYYIIF